MNDSIDQLLEQCGFQSKYAEFFTREKITLTNFGTLLEMNNTGLTMTLLKRCKMPCGDFIKLAQKYTQFIKTAKVIKPQSLSQQPNNIFFFKQT